MFKVVRHSLVVLLLVYLFTASASHASTFDGFGKLPGAKMLHGSCDPNANPSDDATQTTTYLKSCSGQSITRTNFTVTIHFQPTLPALDPFGNSWKYW